MPSYSLPANYTSMSANELQSLLNSMPQFVRVAYGRTGMGPVKTINDLLNKRRREEANAAKSTSTPAASAPAASSASSLGSISSDLQKSRDEFVAARSADIDRDAQRGFQQGMSNMIASGLAGTTAVGGMQAGITEQATRAKANVAATAQRDTQQLGFSYANLANQASQAEANRDTQLQIAGMGSDAAITQAALNQPIVQQADTSNLSNSMRSLQDEISRLQQQVKTLSQGNNMSVGQAPSLF